MSFQPDLGVVVSTFIGVLVGLVVMWITLSCATILIQEMYSTRLKWKSLLLKSGISNMFGDKRLTEQFYDHPIIKSLFTGMNQSIEPDQIPPAQFSLVILDMILSSKDDAVLFQSLIHRIRQEINNLDKERMPIVRLQLQLIQSFTDQLFVADLSNVDREKAIKVVRNEIGILTEYSEENNLTNLKSLIKHELDNITWQKQQISEIVNSFESEKHKSVSDFTFTEQIQLGLAILGVQNPNLKRVISILIVGIDENATKEKFVSKIQKNIEAWYVNSLESINDWHRRRIIKIAIVISFYLALIANADTFQLASQIWIQTGQHSGQVTQTNFPIGWIGTPLPSNVNGAITLPDGTTKRCVLLPWDNASEFYGFHVGTLCYPIINAPRMNDLTGIILKLYGILLTGVISALISPLLRDYLQKHMAIKI